MSTVGSDGSDSNSGSNRSGEIKERNLFKKAILVVVALIMLGFVTFNVLPLIVVSLPAESWQLVKSDVIIVLGTPATRDGKPSPIIDRKSVV